MVYIDFSNNRSHGRTLWALVGFTVTMYWSTYLVMKFNFLLGNSGQKISNTGSVCHERFWCHGMNWMFKKIFLKIMY